MGQSITPGFSGSGDLRNATASVRRQVRASLKSGYANPRDYVDQSSANGGPVISEDTDIGDGSTDARGAVAAADASGSPVLLTPGTYLISSNITIANCICPEPGAVLKPASGTTITLSGGYIATDSFSARLWHDIHS